jgi:hypothetical protein
MNGIMVSNGFSEEMALPKDLLLCCQLEEVFSFKSRTTNILVTCCIAKPEHVRPLETNWNYDVDAILTRELEARGIRPWHM